MEKVRLGIIGYGAMGMPVARYIAVEGHCPEIQLAAVCDLDAGKLADVRRVVFKGQFFFIHTVSPPLDFTTGTLYNTCTISLTNFFQY